MQQDVLGNKRHSLAQQADSVVNPSDALDACRTSSSRKWDLSFLDVVRATTVDGLRRGSGGLGSDSDGVRSDSDGRWSILEGMSHVRNGRLHSYHNVVDHHGYQNLDVHSYQNIDILEPCHEVCHQVPRSRSSGGITDCATNLRRGVKAEPFLLAPADTKLNCVRSATSQDTIASVKAALKIRDEEEALRLRNSLATVVRKACPRKSLGSSASPPCSPRELTRSPQPIVTKSPTSNCFSNQVSPSLHLKSPRNAAMDNPEILVGCSSVSSPVGVRFSRSVSNHSPNSLLCENINTEFFRDLDVFDDVESSKMKSRDQAFIVSFGQPVSRQPVYDTSTCCRTDVRNKEHKGISSHEDIYPHWRKSSSIDGSGDGGEDSGLSSSSSDVVSSRHSPNSLSSELQVDQLSDTGSVIGHLEIRVMDVFDESGCQGLDIRRVECRSRTGSTCDSGSLFVMSDLSLAAPPQRSCPSSCPSSTVSAVGGDEFKCVEPIRNQLTVCRFYFGRMSADEAWVHLAATPVGTYLLRDSSDIRFKYSISVQTTRGPTSIRVGYDESGRFYLDSKPDQMDSILRFDNILALIQFYTRLNAPTERARLPSETCFDTSQQQQQQRDGPVMLLKPYEQDGSASLMHLCRKTINRELDGRSTTRLCLVPSLKGYLNEYPFDF